MEVIVFEQNGSGQQKIAGIEKYGEKIHITKVVTLSVALPAFVDDPENYIGDDFTCDLVLDHLQHPDLSDYLAEVCSRKKIPVVASGKKSIEAFTPFTCCGLGHSKRLGEYGRQFGLPEYKVTLEDDRIKKIQVVRGAPCGATWEVVERVTGSDITEALTLLPREVQYLCVANPSRFDPISGKSPVHYAGDVHSAALKKAIETAGKREL